MQMFSYDPDEYEPVTEHHVCAYHRLYPGAPYAGCTCWGSYSQRRRSDEEISAIRARKIREEEDRVLAHAEAIKARREKASS